MKSFLTLSLLVFMPGIYAADFCGGADVRICVENGTQATISGADLLFPGTTVVFSVPGVTSTSSSSVEGLPERPYRLELAGTVTDDSGGVWGEAEALDEDERGYSAVRFVLTEGILSDPVVITMLGIRVCQRIIDGPGDVIITISFWGSGGKKAAEYSMRLSKTDHGSIDMCADSSGHLPVPEEDLSLFISNPRDVAVAVALDGELVRIEPGHRLQLDAVHATDLRNFGSSLALPVVAFSDRDDLNAVALDPTDNRNWFLPHLARDMVSWRNRWVFANGEAATLTWQRQDGNESVFYEAGTHQAMLEAEAGAASSWARLVANRPLNGFLAFDRNTGTGGAWVNAHRIVNSKTGHEKLFLPHVAADTASFWTGYSLANPYDTDVNVLMRGYGEDGTVVAEETFVIPAGANDIGVIGDARFNGVEVSWIEIIPDQPMSGLELVGSVNSEGGSISGFGLPGEALDQLAFPLVRNGGGNWTGLAVVNTGAEPTDVTLTWYDAQGAVVATEDFTIAPHVKALRVAPDGAAHALMTGNELVAFCLTGADDGRLGGYLGRTY
ncbi:MAG: hypothetical protein QNK37_22310 [Acidobacteriota bacterium]|nr:hypothetical protein [Acidobacteriota bacterium]